MPLRTRWCLLTALLFLEMMVAPPGLSNSDHETATHSREWRRVAVVGKELEKVLGARMDSLSTQLSIIIEMLQSLGEQVSTNTNSLSMVHNQMQKMIFNLRSKPCGGPMGVPEKPCKHAQEHSPQKKTIRTFVLE